MRYLGATCAIGLVTLGVVVGIACDPDPSVIPSQGSAPTATSTGPTITIDGSADVACASVKCGSGTTCCAGACVAAAVDTANCGACNHACAATSADVLSACVSGGCLNLQPVPGATFSNAPLLLVLSGSVLYADEPTLGGIEAQNLGAPSVQPRAIPIHPVFLPVADQRGGIYYFETSATSHTLLQHYDYALNQVITVEDEGAGVTPHVMVRQGASVARIFSPNPGALRVVCANGVVRDITQGSGVAYAAADDDAVYFGVGSPITPATKVVCTDTVDPAPIPNVHGSVLYVDAANVYWFGYDAATMDAAKIDLLYASPKDGTSDAVLLVTPPVTNEVLSFPLLAGDTLYFGYPLHVQNVELNVLSTTSIKNPGVHDLVTSAYPIVTDPAFAYTIGKEASASGDTFRVYRTPVK